MTEQAQVVNVIRVTTIDGVLYEIAINAPVDLRAWWGDVLGIGFAYSQNWVVPLDHIAHVSLVQATMAVAPQPMRAN